MFGIFGKSTSSPTTEAVKPPTTAPSRSAGTFEPVTLPTQPAAGPAKGAEGMFGGMEVVRPRRKKKALDTSTTYSESHYSESHHSDHIMPSPRPTKPFDPLHETAANPTPPQQQQQQHGARDTDSLSTDHEVEEQKPFFMNYAMGSAPVQDIVEDAADTALRQRLVRFYEAYNPWKLSKVDGTVVKFKGKEDELFRLLVKKYGPEPRILQASELQQHVSKSDPTGDASKFDVENSGGGGGFQFGESAGGFGFDGAVAPSESAASGFNFGSGGVGESGNEAVASTWGTGAAGTNETNGFGFMSSGTAPVEGGSLFGAAFAGDVPAAAEGTVGLSFTAGDDAAAAAGPTKPGSGFTLGTGATANAENTSRSSSSSSSSSDDDNLNDRHRREMRDAQGNVLIARGNLATALQSFARQVQARRELLEQYARLNDEIETCVNHEEFEQAEKLSAELQKLQASIAGVDADQERLVSEIPTLEANVATEVKALARLMRQQHEELSEFQEEEERRVRNYISEETFSLEGKSEKLAATLERATRAINNAQDELKNLEKRREKVEAKISEKSGSLLTERKALSKEIEEAEAEIVALEEKLAQLRRAVNDKKKDLKDKDAKISLIAADHADVLSELDHNIAQEHERVREAEVTVNTVAAHKKLLSEEEEYFKEKKEDLEKQLTDNTTRMRTYTVRSAALESETLNEFMEYMRNAVDAVLAQRMAGRHVLVEPVETEEEGDAESEVAVQSTSSPLATVRALESALKTAMKRIESNQELIVSLNLRVQEMKNGVPLLETAKKAAAQAKRFKEAQLKAEEIRVAAATIAETEAQVGQIRSSVDADEKELKRMEAELAVAKDGASKYVSKFLHTYSAAVAKAKVRASSNAPNLLQLPDDELGDDDLHLAVKGLWETLQHEFHTADDTAQSILDEAIQVVEREEAARLEEQRKKKEKEEEEKKKKEDAILAAKNAPVTPAPAASDVAEEEKKQIVNDDVASEAGDEEEQEVEAEASSEEKEGEASEESEPEESVEEPDDQPAMDTQQNEGEEAAPEEEEAVAAFQSGFADAAEGSAVPNSWGFDLGGGATNDSNTVPNAFSAFTDGNDTVGSGFDDVLSPSGFKGFTFSKEESMVPSGTEETPESGAVQQEEEKENVVVAVEAEEPKVNVEEVKVQIAELTSKQDAAAEEENYSECDRLQGEIEALQALLEEQE